MLVRLAMFTKNPKNPRMAVFEEGGSGIALVTCIGDLVEFLMRNTISHWEYFFNIINFNVSSRKKLSHQMISYIRESRLNGLMSVHLS